MRASPAAYLFADDRLPGQSHTHTQHTSPLQILRLNNKGKPRNLDQSVTLRRQPLDSSTTLQSIASNKNAFANSDECLEGDRFVLHFGQYKLL